jgi:hypothetical protein
MLEIGVEHDAGVPGAEIDAGGRRDFFAEISREVDVFDANIFFHDFLYLIVRLVTTPIIDEDEFIGVFASERGKNRPYLVIERADIPFLVVGGDDDGEGFHGVSVSWFFFFLKGVRSVVCFDIGGDERAKEYVITEVGKIYELQGETVSRKHIELIVKQMFSRRKIVDAGDTNLTEGMIVDDIQLAEENEQAKLAGGNPAKTEKLVMGITETSLSRKSFLSAASFQYTTRVLISNATRGAVDDLTGLMENVIIGRLVPAGSGFEGSPKKAMVDAIAPKEEVFE